jgi:hypothetical protein
MAFHEYLGVFLKFFLDDFSVLVLSKHTLPNFNCVSTNVENLVLVWIQRSACFYLLKGHTSWVHYLQGMKITWSKKNLDNREYVCIENVERRIGFQWAGPILLMFHQELCLHYGPHHKILTQNRGVWMDYQMLGSMGGHKIMVFGCTDFNCTQVGHGIPHPHKCVKFGN